MKTSWVILIALTPVIGCAAEPVPALAESPTLVQSLIPFLVPALIALGKTLIPKIPKALLPILAPIIGAGLDILAHYTTGSVLSPMAGAVLGAAGVALRETYDQLKKAGARLSEPPIPPWTRKASLFVLFVPLVLLLGCTNFHAKLKDESPERTISTEITGTAWFSSAQSIAKLKATTTDKTQSIGTDGVSQQGATNSVMALESIARILEAIRPTP